MGTGWQIALIGSLAAIIGSIGLPHLYGAVSSSYVAWISRKTGSIKGLKTKIKEQNREIEKLKNQLSAITMRMDILIPLLRRQLKDDPEAMSLLDHFDIETDHTSAKT